MKAKRLGELLAPIGITIAVYVFLTGEYSIGSTHYNTFLQNNPKQTSLIINVINPIIICIGYFWAYFQYKYNLNKAWASLFIFMGFFYPFIIWDGITPHTGMWFFIQSCVVCSIGMIIYSGFDAERRTQRQKELERQNLKSELALLKNQINPHFLFNTLNNIDSLIKTNTDKASETLIKLSDMLRYMIYDTNVEKVPLSEELEYIENYLKLQKIQFPNTELVNYEINGNTSGVYIAPMLFIPFIENAFKHCTDKSQKDAIHISFTIQEKEILFECRNIADKNKVISKDKSSGVGLNLVKRRLDILYPSKYSLNIEDKDSLFYVRLKVNTK